MCLQLCIGPESCQPAERKPKKRRFKVVTPVESEDDSEIVVTSNALATTARDLVKCPEYIVRDDESIVDNSDGLNVLCDPRAPPPRAGARNQITVNSTTLPAPKTSQPITYPLSLSKTLHSCSTCLPCPEPYSVCATDIPSNGLLSS